MGQWVSVREAITFAQQHMQRYPSGYNRFANFDGLLLRVNWR
jgi:hypothetical protein